MSVLERQLTDREMEMTDIPRGLSTHRNNPRPRGPSALITKYQMIRQMQHN